MDFRWGLYSPFYDLVGGLFMPQRKRSLAQLQPGTEKQLLIAGAGTGLDLRYARGWGKVVALDQSPGMLRVLRQRARRLNQQVEVHQGDVTRLPFPDASFDAILLHFILAVLPEPVPALQEAARALKPEGTIMVLDKFLHGKEEPGLLRRLLAPAARTFATEINYRLEDIVAETSLEIVQNEPAALGGVFRLVRLELNPSVR